MVSVSNGARIDGSDTDNTRCPNRDWKKEFWHRNNKREKALSMRTIAKTRKIDQQTADY